MNMKYWKQFENSGKVEDYLKFVSNKGIESKQDVLHIEGYNSMQNTTKDTIAQENALIENATKREQDMYT